MTVLFGIDVGTSATKGLAITPDGEVIATEEAAYPLSTPRAGWSEQDPEDWWRATETVLEKLTGTAGAPAGIGLSGQMHGLVALDRNDNVIRPAILWNDQRTQAECDEIEDTIGLEKLIALTGNRALTGFTAPKILWLRGHEPETTNGSRTILLPKDYVRLRLYRRARDRRLGRVRDAPARRREPTLEPGGPRRPRARSGLVTDGAREPRRYRDNDENDVPVAAGAGDQAAGAARRGRRSHGAGVGGGRHEWGRVRRARRVRRGRAGPRSRVLPRGPRQLARDGRDAVSRRLAQLAPQRHRPGRRIQHPPQRGRGLAPRRRGPDFLPYLAGERTPHADPDATGAFVGLTLRHDRGALTRAVLEGVAFGLRTRSTSPRSSAAGRKPGASPVAAPAARCGPHVASVLEFRSTGGGRRGGGVRRGDPRWRRGGVWPDVATAVRQTVKPKAPIEPVAEWIEPYREQRERFQALYPALKALR